MQNGASSTFITAPDGLRLHARCYGRRSARPTPVVCLPGLTRTAADFEALASALSHEGPHPRRVIALDYRGRGLSEYDRDPANYSFQIELADVLAVVTALDALPAIFVGTSRGGILTMLLAAVRPTAIAGSRAQRHRPGDRAAGPDAHQELRRQAAAAAKFRGRRRDPAPAVPWAVSKARTGRLACQRPPRFQGRERPDGADLRRQACQDDGRRRRPNGRCRRCGRNSMRSARCR